MRTKNIIYGSFATGIMSFVTLLSGLIIPRQIILAFGSEINGISNSITQFISYFNLIEAGLAGSAIFALYRPLAAKDSDGINSILSASKRYYEKITILFAGCVIIFSILFSIFGSSPLTFSETLLLSLAIGLSGVFEFSTMAKYRVLLTASQKTYIVAYATSFSIILKIVVLYIAIQFGIGIIGIKILTGLTILVRSLLLYLYVRRRFPLVDYCAVPNKGALQQRGDVLLMQVLSSIHHAFPTVLMTFAGLKYTEISVYTVYMSIITGVRSIIQVMLNGSIYSTFGEVISKGEYDLLKKALSQFEVICYSLIAVLFGCLLTLYMPFMHIYTKGMDDGNYLVPYLAYMLTFSAFVSVIRYPLSSMIQAAGHYRKTRSRTIFQSVLAVLVAIVLVKPFGMYGVIFGIILSDLYRTIDVILYVPHRITQTSSLVSLKRIVIAVISIFLSWYSSKMVFTYYPPSYISWLFLAIKVGLINVFWISVLNLMGNRKELALLYERLCSIKRRYKG